MKSIVQAMFMSPSTLHPTELGTLKEPGSVTSLTDHELAPTLSYMLWDSPPDAELTTLADEGELRDPGVLATQAQRRFDAREKGAPAMNHFVEQWLRVENLSKSVKEASVFPMSTPELLEDVKQELQLFTDRYCSSLGRTAASSRCFRAPTPSSTSVRRHSVV